MGWINSIKSSWLVINYVGPTQILEVEITELPNAKIKQFNNMEILSMIFSVAFEIAKQKCTDPHQVLTASLLYKDKTEVTAETLVPHQPQVTNGLQRVVRVKHLSRLMVGVYNRESVVNIFFTYIIYFCLTFNLA